MDNDFLEQFNDGELTWAEKEFITVELGDKRLERRLKIIANEFSKRPEANIPQAMTDWPSIKATYRFFDNKKIDEKKILNSHKESVCNRLNKLDTIFAIQDTSFIDYSSHPCTENLGLTCDNGHHGLIIHPTLLCSVEGVPLGIIDLQFLHRESIGEKKKRKKKPIEKKESIKWLNSYRATLAISHRYPNKQFINISDRESDIYEYFDEVRKQKKTFSYAPDILLRAKTNRIVDNGNQRLLTQLKSKKEAGKIELKVPRKEKQKERKATLLIRYDRVTIKAPKNLRSNIENTLGLYAIYLEEINHPKGVEAIKWMLLTSIEINSVLEAIDLIKAYTKRWLIETYFKTLKSGCTIENRQLQAAHRLKSCLAVDAVVAWRILFLTMVSRELPEIEATVLFEKQECDALYSFIKDKPVVCDVVPSLGEVVKQIGKLGGFIGRKRDGKPGVISIWRGMWRLADIYATYKLFMAKNNIPQTYG